MTRAERAYQRLKATAERYCAGQISREEFNGTMTRLWDRVHEAGQAEAVCALWRNDNPVTERGATR